MKKGNSARTVPFISTMAVKQTSALSERPDPILTAAPNG